MWTIVIIVWLIFAIIGAKMAEKRGRSTAGWALVCGLTGIIGVLILAIAGQSRAEA